MELYQYGDWVFFKSYICFVVPVSLILRDRKVYLKHGSRCVLDGIRHVQRRRQAHFHASVQKTKGWEPLCLFVKLLTGKTHGKVLARGFCQKPASSVTSPPPVCRIEVFASGALILLIP